MSTSPLVKGYESLAIVASTANKHNPTIKDFHFRDGLPSAAELPDSDDRPVDSELQELIPGLLKAILLDQWRNRADWLFGIDLGLYYDPDQPCIAPDGFLSLGVQDTADENLRPSYVLWDEQVIPLLALEVVSKAYRQEHSRKLAIYQSIGILYYVIYAPLRKKKARFQIYKLINGEYILKSEGPNPIWMPEINLGIGLEKGNYGNRCREWLYWYNEYGIRYPTPTERAEVAERRADILMERLRELGVDPATLD